VSVDHVPCLKAWAESIGGISYPLLSDFWPHGEIARRYGILRDEGYSERTIVVIDRTGVIRYLDVHDIDDAPSNEELLAVLGELEPTLAAAVAGAPVAAPDADIVAGELIMYCTPWCPDCRQAREWLEMRGITYTEVDVSRDSDARQRAADHNEGRLHTPTFECRDRVVIDFTPEDVSRLLDETRS